MVSCSSVRFWWRPFIGGLLLLVAPLLLTSCDDNSVAPETLKEQALQRQRQIRTADSLTITKYIADSSLTNAQRQPSGLYIIYKNTSTGAMPTPRQTATVLYKGSFLDIRGVFDPGTDKDNNPKPYTFTLGQSPVIVGFEEGVSLMRLGQKAILLIPSELAYGPNGASTIPPDSPLRFDVELTNIR
ncbi:FKBP-type peptidyl-prolyl cis-trans isomerase [Hymenobacter norwichensis]|uniref:FKBP-type peptidyl-prolyl cis-trans isomerase n=1 Tax=Hymenobacter norwichensis TaxID=223903 RepID=UPI0012FBEB48|nr:FKBP-type peptidyl-prolyl cis-trans isomerase [Hymenobacter norwichensis]